jgi:hypothetical protein
MEAAVTHGVLGYNVPLFPAAETGGLAQAEPDEQTQSE